MSPYLTLAVAQSRQAELRQLAAPTHTLAGTPRRRRFFRLFQSSAPARPAHRAAITIGDVAGR